MFFFCEGCGERVGLDFDQRQADPPIDDDCHLICDACLVRLLAVTGYDPEASEA